MTMTTLSFSWSSPSAGPPGSTSEMTIDVSPFSKWGLSRPPDTAIPNPLLESFCRVTVYCSHISSSMPGAWQRGPCTGTALCFLEYFRLELQPGYQSHSQGDDGNVVLRTLERVAAAAGGVGRWARTRAALRGAGRRGTSCWAGVPCAPCARRWQHFTRAGVREAPREWEGASGLRGCSCILL